MMRKALLLLCLLQFAASAEFYDMTARGERADLNRISVHAQVIKLPLRLGLEYERTLVIWGWFKPALAASANTGSQVLDDSARGLRNSEYTSYIDAPLRLAIMPSEYFHIYAGGGVTFYSSTIRLQDNGGKTGIEGSASHAGAAPFVEGGFRLCFGAYSVGLSGSFASVGDFPVTYSYLSAGNRVFETFSHQSFIAARMSLFAGFLF